MKIFGARDIRQYSVRFTVEESKALRAIGYLPPWGRPEAELRLTRDEIILTAQEIGLSGDEWLKLADEADLRFPESLT